ncbi:Pentatricopeptide repeat-containing protein At3g29290 [Linum perenne]
MMIRNWVDTVCLCGSYERKSGPLYEIAGALSMSFNGCSQLRKTLKIQLVKVQSVRGIESESAMEAVQSLSKVHLLEETDEQKLSERILMLSRSNKVRTAMELFKSMVFMGLIANRHACNSLVASLLRKERFEEAWEVFEFMKLNEITTAHTYSMVLKAVADTRGCDSVLSMFRNLDEKDCDVVVYNTVISICGRTHDWGEAEKVWRTMNERECLGSQVTYSLLVSIFFRCGKNKLALDAYTEMRRNRLRFRPGDDDDALEIVIVLLAKQWKWDLALEHFYEMVNHGKSPSLDTCHSVMNSLGLAGKTKMAFRVMEKLETLGHEPNWNVLLKALYRGNRHFDVIRLFEALETRDKSVTNEQSYRTVIMSCQKLGSWEKAIQLLWKMENSSIMVSSLCYNLVIGACEMGKNADAGLRVYERMMQMKRVPDRFTYLSLIRACISESMWSEVEGILDVAADETLYRAAMNAMWSSGNFEAAKKLSMLQSSK